MLVGCVDFPVEKVVSLEGSADSPAAQQCPAVPVSTATSCSATPAVVSDVVLPSSPVSSNAEISPVPANQLPASLHSPGHLSADDETADTEETRTESTAVTDVENASLMHKTCSSSPSNAVTSPPRLAKAESSSELHSVDDASVSVTVSESS